MRIFRLEDLSETVSLGPGWVGVWSACRHAHILQARALVCRGPSSTARAYKPSLQHQVSPHRPELSCDCRLGQDRAGMCVWPAGLTCGR